MRVVLSQRNMKSFSKCERACNSIAHCFAQAVSDHVDFVGISSSSLEEAIVGQTSCFFHWIFWLCLKKLLVIWIWLALVNFFFNLKKKSLMRKIIIKKKKPFFIQFTYHLFILYKGRKWKRRKMAKGLKRMH